jgi:hypothetical protein
MQPTDTVCSPDEQVSHTTFDPWAAVVHTVAANVISASTRVTFDREARVASGCHTTLNAWMTPSRSATAPETRSTNR